ncbi:MAG: hypothetical protein ACI4L6_03720 [Candidatus Onthoplasma sp.]
MKTDKKLKIITDCICGCIILLSVLAYLLVGFLAKVWHPTWLIIVGGVIICGVVGIIVDTIYRLKYPDTEKDHEVEE